MCAWQNVGEMKICGERCIQEYCKVHLARIRKGRKIPVPCRSCGCGVQSEIQLCRNCGRDRIRSKHITLEKRAKEHYVLVMQQLLALRTPI